MLDLTKDERRFVELAARRHQGFLCRRNRFIGWIGVALFFFSFSFVPLPEWLRFACGAVVLPMVMLSFVGLTMSAAGKLYRHIQILENQPTHGA